ncbi:MAG: hypothetical protein AB1401_10635 [Thermodesulfobacteriota bacterium]
MNCKKAKDLILTDYLDGYIKSHAKGDIEDHIKHCNDCREFLMAASKTVIEPFDEAIREKTPESVWQNLRAAIPKEHKQNYYNPINVFLEGLRSLTFIPKPRLVFVSLLSILLIVVLSITFFPVKQNQELAKIASDKQVEYLTYLMSYPDIVANNGSSGYGTDIEEYFL